MSEAIGWSVVHALWQGAVAALALAIVLAATRSARARYGAACAALLAMTAGFGVTLWRSWPAAAAARVTIVAGNSRPAAAAGDWWRAPEGGGMALAMPWIGAFWAAGVLAFQLRAMANWRAARRLRFTGVCATPAMWTERLDALRERLRVSRAVALLESGLAEAPAVIGHARPIILMPVGLMAGLPVAQVEAILLHELAHVRRGDYLVNVLQSVAEAIFFFHPAAWWISSVMRSEREHCCDDLVVATQGDARAYAAALAAVEQTRWAADPALAATGGDLMKRIRRLLKQQEGPRAGFAPVIGAALIAVAAGMALYGWQERPAQEQKAEVASPYAKWVKEDVVYIISDRERAAFQALTTDEEREHFIEQFWTRRDPTPGTPENEMKEEHYRRIGYANERFAAGIPGWKTDRGRIYIVYGPPDEIESHPSGGGRAALNYPYEEWLYRKIEGIGTNVVVRFEDPAKSGEYRQTVDPR